MKTYIYIYIYVYTHKHMNTTIRMSKGVRAGHTPLAPPLPDPGQP